MKAFAYIYKKLRKVGSEELQRLFFWQHLQTFKPKLSVYYHNKQYVKKRKGFSFLKLYLKYSCFVITT